MRILLAEDNRTISKLVKAILEQQGYTVTAVDNGLEALQQVLMNRPDAVVLDGKMPVMDGWETCRRIKAQQKTPVMMLTVQSEAAEVEYAYTCGADAFMSKPFDVAAFVATVRRLVAPAVAK
ncbi:MAG: hypothetical protein NVS4B8_27190 [Herpetosiphon sp.]